MRGSPLPKPAGRGWNGGVGASSALLAPESARFVPVAAAHPHPVLLCGETGCGKTYLARTIHELSPRRRGPFVAVNCAAIPESLFERELFGHVRGAFTGAHDGAPGFLETAHGGTLLLDEVGELPLSLQPKLLTVLEEGVFRRIGSPRQDRVDVKVIVATNRDVDEMVAHRTFRQDLFFRCSVFQHRLPPLRERRKAMPHIVRTMLEEESAAAPPRISQEALTALSAHSWPGNLRELQNALRYACVLAGDGPIRRTHLPDHVGGTAAPHELPDLGGEEPLSSARYRAPTDEVEELEMIREALRLEGGNRTRAARRLGMSRTSLWVKLRIHEEALRAVG